MLWHAKVRDYCYRLAIVVYGWNRNVVFLPYKLDGKVRVEVYDLYLYSMLL
jgi:hypothetical protein